MAVAQVGIKIPVYIMTEKGWNIVNNHLHEMNKDTNNFAPDLLNGDELPVFINDSGMIRELKKRDIKNVVIVLILVYNVFSLNYVLFSL